jgi:membrane protein DedA with SNARE-associated domain
VLQVLAVLRGALGIIAIPLAPALYKDHLVGLVLLRPTKDVLLYVGFRLRDGSVGLVPILLASVPLAVFGVWHFFVLGRAYSKELHDGDLPKVAEKLMPPKRVKALSKLLDEKGTRVVLIGRLAAFPSVLLAAAAGASDMKPRRFLPVDGVAALLSIAEVLLAGYVFGEAYKRAGTGVTVLGVALMFGLLFVVGRALRQES